MSDVVLPSPGLITACNAALQKHIHLDDEVALLAAARRTKPVG